MKDVQSYYDSLAEKEYDRLGPSRALHYQLEFERTIDTLVQHLPENGHILDAGGGAGRYTEWLAEQGYTVTLVDLSPQQVRHAQDILSDYDSVNICNGTIDQLPIQNNVFDAIVCTGGPLSHLIDKQDRVNAVTEFKRVGKSNSYLFISVMSLINALQNLVSNVPEFDQTAMLPEFIEDGVYSHERAQQNSIVNETEEFTECKFYRANEFRNFLTSQDLKVHEILGLESIAYGSDKNMTDKQEKSVRDTITELGNDDTIAEISAHMLATCQIQ